MKLYLAGTKGIMNEDMAPLSNILESYYALRGGNNFCQYIPKFKSFILDSGAFTFMGGGGDGIDYDNYTRKYAEFINKNNIAKFFELDIDGVVGWEKYSSLRKLLEDLTGKDPIPVMHRSRGKDYYLQLVQDHDYVAVGGIAAGHVRRTEYAYLEWFITEAHNAGAKIHGLGFTNLTWLEKLRWDSVDSTTWDNNGARFGKIYHFFGNTLINQHPKKVMKDQKELRLHNFIEWVKFGEYLEGVA